MQILNAVLAAILALGLAGVVKPTAPRRGTTPTSPAPMETNEGGGEVPPRK